MDHPTTRRHPPGRPGRSERRLGGGEGHPRGHGNRIHPPQPLPSIRLFWVYGLLCLALGGLGVRLVWLQVLQGETLQTKARRIQTQSVKPLGTRRTIVDRVGRLVAIDEERFNLWAHPRYFSFLGDAPNTRRRPEEVAAKLADVLARPREDLLKALQGRKSGVKLAANLDPETSSKVKRLEISGLDLEPYPQRIYPQGSLFANVVGFLNLDRVPQAGLEQSRDHDLKRQETTFRMRRGGDGTPLPDGLQAGSLYGDDLRLQLTLDSRLQLVAQQAVAKQMKQWKAKRGVALVMDAQSGELLALASAPTYDPNRYWNFNPGFFREWSVQDLYEPGSTFKPINLAIALQEKAIDPKGTVNDVGQLTIGGWPIFNANRRGNGVIDFATVLQVSSNVGMVAAMGHLKREVFWQWLNAIGIHDVPDTDLPGAVAGQLKPKEEFVSGPIEPATAAFGQGFSLTPLKLVQLHAMLANGGRLVSPHITRGLRSGEGLATAATQTGVQLLDPKVTRQVVNWMETVVEKGTGKGMKIPGYRIAGKTGTAQKAHNGIYIPGARITSFVAILPVESPRYVVLVVMDEPQGGNAYGSTVALPVARQIVEALLVLEKVPPSLPDRINPKPQPARPRA